MEIDLSNCPILEIPGNFALEIAQSLPKGIKFADGQEEVRLRRGQVPPCKKRILLALPVWSA